MANSELNIEKFFMYPRFEVIADYPPTTNEIANKKKGEIIEPSTLEYAEPYFKYPYIFRKMDWWEKRSVGVMLNIKNIEIVNHSYYIKGDKIISVPISHPSGT